MMMVAVSCFSFSTLYFATEREREVEGRRRSVDHGRLGPDLSGISGEPGSLSSSHLEQLPRPVSLSLAGSVRSLFSLSGSLFVLHHFVARLSR